MGAERGCRSGPLRRATKVNVPTIIAIKTTIRAGLQRLPASIVVGCFFPQPVCPHYDSYRDIPPRAGEFLPHRPAEPRESTGFSLLNYPPKLNEERELALLPFGGLEAHEDKDFDNGSFVTFDMLGSG
jgi:hypothetical protein